MLSSKLGIRGDVYFTVTDINGGVRRFEVKNRITQAGMEMIIQGFRGGGAGMFRPTTMTLGSNNTPPTGFEADLLTPVTSAPINVTNVDTFPGETTLNPASGGAVEFRANFPLFTAPVVLQECGMFCSTVLFSRCIYPVINIENGMSVDINWVISFTSL